MRPTFAVGLLIVSSCLGCAMCASPHDCKYAAYGGRRERSDMVHGRVGSIFDPAPEVAVAPSLPLSGQPVPTLAEPAMQVPAEDAADETPSDAAEQDDADSAERSPLDELESVPESNDEAIRREFERLPQSQDRDLPDLPGETRRPPAGSRPGSETAEPVTRSIIRQMLGELIDEEHE